MYQNNISDVGFFADRSCVQTVYIQDVYQCIYNFFTLLATVAVPCKLSNQEQSTLSPDLKYAQR